MDAQPPERVGERWTRERMAGRSLLGRAWSVTDAHSGQPALLEIVRRRSLPDEAARLAFARAALDTTGVLHPGLVRTLDAGTDGDRAWVATEPHRGCVADYVAEHGPLDPRDVARVAVELARGLAVLHERGHVHGGITPQALVFRPDGRVALAYALTGLLGVPADPTDPFAAPERIDPANPAPPSAAGDQYALAATLLWMMTASVQCGLHVTADRETAVSGLPTTLSSVVHRALAARPGHRYATASAFADALGFALGEVGDFERAKAPAHGWARLGALPRPDRSPPAARVLGPPPAAPDPSDSRVDPGEATLEPTDGQEDREPPTSPPSASREGARVRAGPSTMTFLAGVAVGAALTAALAFAAMTLFD